MKILKPFLISVFVIALAACSEDKAPAPASEKTVSKPAAAKSEPAASSEASTVIDHAKDTAEFELRRSIAGLERMIAQYKADGYASDELEAQKTAMSAELDKLLAAH